MKAKYRVAIVDAHKIAMDTLGVPIVNTAMIGALVKATNLVDIQSLNEPLEHRFGRLADRNLNAVNRAHDEVTFLNEASDLPAEGPDEEDTSDNELKIDALAVWSDLELGCDIKDPGSSLRFHTGNWRTTGKPVTDYEKCIKCGLCQILCPDMAYKKNAEGYFELDERYCKGCGICAEECPKDAIEMKEEV